MLFKKSTQNICKIRDQKEHFQEFYRKDLCITKDKLYVHDILNAQGFAIPYWAISNSAIHPIQHSKRTD